MVPRYITAADARSMATCALLPCFNRSKFLAVDEQKMHARSTAQTLGCAMKKTAVPNSGQRSPCCDRLATRGNAATTSDKSRLLAGGGSSTETIRAASGRHHEYSHARIAQARTHGRTGVAWFHVAASPSPRQAWQEAATSRAAHDAPVPLPSPPQSRPSLSSTLGKIRSAVTWIDLNPLGTD